jgi:chromosome segregation ATPase
MRENRPLRAASGPEGGASAESSRAASIEELTERYQALQQKKIRAEANKENAQERLTELKTEAQELYGTDDVAELEKMLARMEKENTERRAAYQEELDAIERDLAAVEKADGA